MGRAFTLDCFASLAMTGAGVSLRDGGNIVAVGEAIQTGGYLLDCFATLAMTSCSIIHLRLFQNRAWFCSRRDPGALRGWTYNPQRPVSGFRPGRGTPTVCFSPASVRGRCGGLTPAEGDSGGRKTGAKGETSPFLRG
jgi:hypothetical protein